MPARSRASSATNGLPSRLRRCTVVPPNGADVHNPHRPGPYRTTSRHLYRPERLDGPYGHRGVLAQILRSARPRHPGATPLDPRSRDRLHWMAGAVLPAGIFRSYEANPAAPRARASGDLVWRAADRRGPDHRSDPRIGVATGESRSVVARDH